MLSRQEMLQRYLDMQKSFLELTRFVVGIHIMIQDEQTMACDCLRR